MKLTGKGDIAAIADTMEADLRAEAAAGEAS